MSTFEQQLEQLRTEMHAWLVGSGTWHADGSQWVSDQAAGLKLSLVIYEENAVWVDVVLPYNSGSTTFKLHEGTFAEACEKLFRECPSMALEFFPPQS